MNWLLKSSICLLSVHVFVASCSLVDRDRQEQLPLQEEASGPRRQLKNGHADRNEHEKDATIKKAVMKEILKLLGMKHRPPPIPLAKRKPNIPRPVYDGGIGGMSPDEDVKLQETQVVIAAEVDEDEGTNDNEEVPRFKFKLNHALFNDYVINYATLHVYNEADVGSEYGVFKTIYLKETLPARSGRPQGTNSKTFNLDKITKDKHQQAAKKSQETTHQAQGVDFKGSVHQKEAKTENDKGFFAHAARNSSEIWRYFEKATPRHKSQMAAKRKATRETSGRARPRKIVQRRKRGERSKFDVEQSDCTLERMVRNSFG
eukprot:gene7724-8563_t